MTEYMTMAEAFQCGDNDIPFIEDEFNCNSKYTKGYLRSTLNDVAYRPSYDEMESDQWQVIKAETKVLTAEEWSDCILQLEESTQTYKELTKICELPPKRLSYIIKRVAKDSFEEGDKNGWNRTKELREAVGDYIKKEYLIGSWTSVFNDAMKNLKPPCQ